MSYVDDLLKSLTVLVVAYLFHPVNYFPIQIFLIAICVMPVIGVAPCQCFSFGGNQTTSPDVLPNHNLLSQLMFDLMDAYATLFWHLVQMLHSLLLHVLHHLLQTMGLYVLHP